MGFERAQRRKVKLRLGTSGPSGSGKTFTSLRIAAGLAEMIGSDARIALIDSEDDSASFYADVFDFDTCSLKNKRVDDYVSALTEAARVGYGIVIIDSLSHAWQELVAEVEHIAKARYRGNTWSAWSEGTPKQQQLINALQRYPGHLIATMRAKTEWAVEEGKGGKSRPVRVGLAPEQRKGMEYEFDVLLQLSQDHIGEIVKSRIAQLQDRVIEKPGQDLGREIYGWLSQGAGSAAPAPSPTDDHEPTSVGDLGRRLRECPTREDLEALTAEIEAAGVTGDDREQLVRLWRAADERLPR